MSFAYDTKEELCREAVTKRSLAVAEAYGVLMFCNTFSPARVRIITECVPFMKRLPRLFSRAFGVKFDELPALPEGPGKRSFSITDPAALEKIMETYGYGKENAMSLHINFAVLEEEPCRAAFFRGAFLAGGSVTAPEKRYHLELVTSHYSVSRELQALFGESGFRSRETTRKSNYVTYFKQSEVIEDLLTAMGAPLAAMELMNQKAEKLMRNSINRHGNCDFGNLGKVVDAAQEQLAAIRRLEERGALAALPDKLQEAARLRRENPEASLSELAGLCVPPVTKSCLNHRLRKLTALAGEESPAERPAEK